MPILRWHQRGAGARRRIPGVRAWSCAVCRTDWAFAVVNPQPYFDQLAATVERLSATRSVLRRIIALAEDSATLSNQELRDRLTALTQVCAR